jgi:hypothetical protein
VIKGDVKSKEDAPNLFVRGFEALISLRHSSILSVEN